MGSGWRWSMGKKKGTIKINFFKKYSKSEQIVTKGYFSSNSLESKNYV